ncbi:MAG: phage baseplate protein, partial [Xylella fastidiosa subsp. multiplex]
TRALTMDLYAATAQALAAHEPRITLRQVTARATASGTVTLALTAHYLPEGKTVTLDGIQVR